MDHRIKKLADILVDYSCKVKKKEKVMIECHGFSALPLVKRLVEKVYEVGGLPFVVLNESSVMREIIKGCEKEQLRLMTDFGLSRMKKMDVFIGIRAHDNVNELGDLEGSKLNEYMRDFSSKIVEERVNNTRWVVLRWPNNSMAQLANTSLESFTDFYFDVCTMDYNKMSKAMDPLIGLMGKTDKVRIEGPGTDLEFSIKGIPTIKAAGEANIPDGEVFTAPVKDSLQGHVTFNTPAVYQGVTYENIYFKFKNGKIIEASANFTERINKVLDTDKGARFLGEFAIGLNPFIDKPMKDPLFDEKIMGSIHLTPGNCYEEASNGNKSAIHWDLVLIQLESSGGGNIYFDDVLIRKNGLFVIEDLKPLNPENLR